MAKNIATASGNVALASGSNVALTIDFSSASGGVSSVFGAIDVVEASVRSDDGSSVKVLAEGATSAMLRKLTDPPTEPKE